MNKALLIPSVIISTIFVLIYALLCFRNKTEFNQKIIINLILQAFQVVCGAVLMLSPVIPDLKDLLTDIDLYIFIAGAVLLMNSGQGVISDLKISVRDLKKPIQPTAGISND